MARRLPAARGARLGGVRHIAAHLSDEAEVEAIKLPLRLRLLTALPAINVVTGVLVVGLVEGGHPGLGALGIAVGVSVAVALSVAFAFTVLLFASVVSPVHRLERATARIGEGDLAIRVPVSASDETGALTRAFNRMTAGAKRTAACSLWRASGRSASRCR